MDTAGETPNSTSTMPSYSLRFQKDITHFIYIVNQLLEISEEDNPRFFKTCVQGIAEDMYDKIVELNGSKRRSKHWSDGYMQCITLSKKLISTMNTLEKNENLRYNTRVHVYEEHYGVINKREYRVSFTPVPTFNE